MRSGPNRFPRWPPRKLPDRHWSPLYESRRKAERDYRAGVDVALDNGREEGERLALVGVARFFQMPLHEPPSPESELVALDPESLRALCATLRDRRSADRQG